ncbi:MAG: hypothetical protein V3T89_00115 [bacterium]
MLVFSIISFVLSGLSLVGGLLTEGSIRFSFLIGSILFLLLAAALILGRRAVKRSREDISFETQVSEKTGKESEIVKVTPISQGPTGFLREQDIVFGPNGKGAFSVSLWLEEQPKNSQESLGMLELDYLFLELEGDYKLIRRKEEVNGKDYIVHTFQSSYQVYFNQSRYVEFEEKEDKSYSLQIKLGRLKGKIDQTAADTLIIRATLPAKINMANSMTYEDKTVEWQLAGAHFRKDLTLQAFTVPFALS